MMGTKKVGALSSPRKKAVSNIHHLACRKKHAGRREAVEVDAARESGGIEPDLMLAGRREAVHERCDTLTQYVVYDERQL